MPADVLGVTVPRLPLLLLFLVLLAGAVRASPAAAMASHYGWPPKDGMLLMNAADSSRALDARPGADPFGSRNRHVGCKDNGKLTSSCRHRVQRVGHAFAALDGPQHNRLYGGHGDDVILAGNAGDVLWGDFKPSGQPTSQRDALVGGPGSDFIYAGHGRNLISGGAGMDIIHGHFGRGVIDCGPGRDIVYIKRRHQYKLRRCEVVSRRTGQSAPKWVLRRLPWPLADN